MKTLKLALLPLFALLLTGCYTQLEYSQTMKRITDAKNPGGYSWNDDSENSDKEYQDTESVYIAETERAKEYDSGEYEQEYYDREYEENYYSEPYEDEYYPVTYRDYGAVNRWNDCDCNPYVYNNYNFYGGSHSYYSPYYSSYWSPGWSFSIRFGYSHRYHHYGFRTPLVYYAGFGWGLPIGYPYSYYHTFNHHYYGSYLYPFAYDPFFYGRSAVIYNAYFVNTHNGSGVFRSSSSKDVRVGRRSIGTKRVNSVRQRNATGRTATGQKFKTTKERRKRTSGVTRIRSNNNNRNKRSSAVQSGKSRYERVEKNRRTKSRGRVINNNRRQYNSEKSVRQEKSYRNRRYKVSDRPANVSRTRLINRNNVRNPDLEQSRKYLQKRKVDTRNRYEKRRSSYFGTFRGLFQFRSESGSSSKSIRYRQKSGKTNSKSYRKSNSRTKRSSVTRSRSSSRSSSKGTSRSRSRSSNNEDRSRNNN